MKLILWTHIQQKCIAKTYLISPTYVIIGASINPTPNPSNVAAMYISSNDDAKYSIVHAMMCGILTKIIAFFRPSGSDTKPEKTLPIG